MLQNLPLGRGSFHNAFVKDTFCDFFAQHCHISINMENVGLVIAPYSTQFWAFRGQCCTVFTF